MKPYFIYISLLAVGLFATSCSSSTEEESKEEVSAGLPSDTTKLSLPNMSKEELHEAMYDHSEDFYRTYQGTVGDLDIQVNLVKTGSSLSGSYYYEKHGQPIDLSSGKLTPKGYFELTEYNANVGKNTGSFTGRFIGGRIEAIWQNPGKDKKLDVQLETVQADPEERMTGEVFHRETINYYTPGDTTTPNYTQIYTVVLPSEGYSNESVETLYRSLEGFFGKQKVSGNPIQSMENLRKENMQEYREALKPLMENEDMRNAASLEWSSISKMEIVYNANGLLSCAWNYYDYTGGAHGNYGRSYHTYNLQTGEKLQLADIFKPGYEKQLQPMLIAAVKEAKSIPPEKKLEDAGFYPEEVKPTQSFFLTHKGIGFYYSPYEIAPYAAGGTEAFIPFSDCRDLLKDEAAWRENAAL